MSSISNINTKLLLGLILVLIVAVILLSIHIIQLNRDSTNNEDPLQLLSYKAYCFLLAYNNNFTEYVDTEAKYLGVEENYQHFSKEDIFKYLNFNNRAFKITTMGPINSWYVDNNVNHVRVSFSLGDKDSSYIKNYEAEFKKIKNKWQLIFIGNHQ